jgi:hypothetical protein
LQLGGDFVVSLQLLSNVIMMAQDYLLWVGSVICVTMTKGSIPDINTVRAERTNSMYSPIHSPRKQFKAARSDSFVWHRIFNCRVVDIKGPIAFKVF